MSTVSKPAAKPGSKIATPKAPTKAPVKTVVKESTAPVKQPVKQVQSTAKPAPVKKAVNERVTLTKLREVIRECIKESYGEFQANFAKLKEAAKPDVPVVQSDDEVALYIKKVQADVAKVTELQSSIEHVLTEIKRIEKTNEKTLDAIIEYMNSNEKKLIKFENITVQVLSKKKYKVATPSYKELWEEGLKKVNTAIKNVLLKVKDDHIEEKKNAVMDYLDITTEAVVSSTEVNDFLVSLKTVLPAIAELVSAVDEFEKINAQVQ